MRRGSGATAAVLAAALLLSGCGSSERAGVAGTQQVLEPGSGWASAEELRWLRNYGAWQEQFAHFAAQVEETAQWNGFTAALTPLANCGRLLENDVGPGPTERLNRVARMLARACDDWRVAGFTAMSAGDDKAALAKVRGRVRRAVETMRRASSRLPPGATQPLPKGEPSTSESRSVPFLSRVGSRLARRRVEVRCWTRADWNRLVREEREISVSRVDQRAAGITSVASGDENLRPEICERLAALTQGTRSDGAGEYADAFALLVLAHESQHAAGVGDEVVADCRGMQTMRRAGVLLGLSSEHAQRLAEDYWRLYPRQPDVYVSRHCRDGGRLDLRPRDSTWP